MKIRTRLALRFTIIVASILVLFAVAVYYSSSSYREQEFFSRLHEKANNTAKLLVDVDEVSSELLKIIDKNTVSLVEERIVVYDHNGKELYNSIDDDSYKPNKKLLQEIRSEGQITQRNGERELLGILYVGKHDKIVVIASAFDKYGLGKLRNLRIILIIGLIACVLVTTIAGWLYAGQALNPISDVVDEVDNITASKLSQRVNEGNGTDEIAHLAVTFNRMLDRIENAFMVQKSFVSNASHELRTPLTAITGQLEVALINERTAIEYQNVIGSVLDDIKNLNRLTNGLLELAQADMDTSSLKLREIRVDELLWQARNDILKRSPLYKINVEVSDIPDDEKQLAVYGSEQLLKTAIMNMLDNACKFSPDQQVLVVFAVKPGLISLVFTDYGIGISDEDMSKIFEPFYRGYNAKTLPGHGLGVSLTRKIILLHKGTMEIKSKVNQFTSVMIELPSCS